MNYLGLIKQVTKKEKVYEWTQEVDLWESWYRGKCPQFHNYSVYNGNKMVECERMSLQMAKRVCEDWANLLINEKTEISAGSDEQKQKLWDILEEIKFWRKANEGVEKSFALGMGALVLSVEDITTNENGDIVDKSGTVNLKFVSRKKMIPLTVEDDEITECAFVSKNTTHTFISIHLFNAETNTYNIHNIVALGVDDALIVNLEDPTQYWVFDTKSDKKWFFVVKPNIADNNDIDSPFGISVYANAIDVLKSVDIVYDGYATEFLLGRKRIFMSAKHLFVDPVTKELKSAFDARDILVYIIPEQDDGKPFYELDNGELRVEAYNAGLQQQLNLLSYNCGLGNNHYKFDNGGVSTATQVISENSEMFRTIKKHEILLSEVLVEFIKTLAYVVDTFTADTIGELDNVEIKFDDSIIEDKEAEKESDRRDVQMNLMSAVEYRMKHYAEDESTATEKIAEISKYSLVDEEEEPTEEPKEGEQNEEEGEGNKE